MTLGNALGREMRVEICALKGQHIVENKYIALSGRIGLRGTLLTQRVALGYHMAWLSAT